MTLAELITRVEQGSGSDRQLDADICVAARYIPACENAKNIKASNAGGAYLIYDDYGSICGVNSGTFAPHLTSSLDAIRALMIARLEGYWVHTRDNPKQLRARVEVLTGDKFPYEVNHPDIHRAFLSATLKAIAAKEG